MYLCLSTGQGEGNGQVTFASMAGSGQWFVKLLEQKHLFPGMSSRLGTALPDTNLVFCLGSDSRRMLWGTENLSLSIQQSQDCFGICFINHKRGWLRGQENCYQLTNTRTEGRGEGGTPKDGEHFTSHLQLFGLKAHNEELYPLRILPPSFSKAFLRGSLNFSLQSHLYKWIVFDTILAVPLLKKGLLVFPWR